MNGLNFFHNSIYMAKIINFYEQKKVKKYLKKADNPSWELTNIDLNSRILIVGSSGSGKTNCLLQYIYNSPDTFQKIIIVNKGIEEPLYEFLKNEKELKGKVLFYTLANLPSMEELKGKMEDPDDQYLVVFDDLVNDIAKDTKIKNYYIAGRKCNMTMVFLSQSYFKVDKVIRGQLNYLILLKLSSNKDLKLVLSDYSLGVEKEELIEIWKDATKEKFSFLKIDINTGDPNKKFSKGFLDYYELGEVEESDEE